MNQHRQLSYFVCGLHLEVDRPVPGLTPLVARNCVAPDVVIRFGTPGASPQESVETGDETLFYTSYLTDELGNPALTIWKRKGNGAYHIRYSHGLEFHIDRTASFLRVDSFQAMRPGDVAQFLLGPVLGILLRLRNVTCLHASSVAQGKRAVAFVGREGSGKSTTAALFVRRGHAALSDDMVALAERGNSFCAFPCLPHLNLWPESVEMLCGSAAELPCAASGSEKRRLTLDGQSPEFQREPLPLAAIYVLTERRREPGAPFLERLSPREALIELAKNSYAARMLDSPMRAREFRFLGRLVRLIPVSRVVAREDPGGFNRLYTLLRADITRARRGPWN